MVDAADIITNLTPHNSSQSFEQDNLPNDGSCKSIPKVYAAASDSPSEFSGYNLQNKLPGNQLDPLQNTTGGQCKNDPFNTCYAALHTLYAKHINKACYLHFQN